MRKVALTVSIITIFASAIAGFISFFLINEIRAHSYPNCCKHTFKWIGTDKKEVVKQLGKPKFTMTSSIGRKNGVHWIYKDLDLKLWISDVDGRVTEAWGCHGHI
jgi:hypothetical protein